MRLGFRCLLKNSSVSTMVDFYAQFNPSPLSIKQFIDFGLNPCERKSFMFLRRELPVRLANIMKEIRLLPEDLLKMPSVEEMNEWYAQSFEDIVQFERADHADVGTLDTFCQTLVQMVRRHSHVVEAMAQGILELKEIRQVDSHTEGNIQYFLDRFFMSRISIRMLVDQHTSMFGKLSAEAVDPNCRHIGLIDPQCDLGLVAMDAFESARFLCERYYMASPELTIEQYNTTPRKDDPVKMVYVPSHLYHILFELFKNSMRAVVEHHLSEKFTDNDSSLPSIRVLIVKGTEDVCVKISDKGGGVPRSAYEKLFHYMYSTAPKPSEELMVPLAGYGYGLPIARLYARYFHGDLMLLSCDGYGMEAIVYLKALSDEANELLPVFNKTSTRYYNSIKFTRDWSGKPRDKRI